MTVRTGGAGWLLPAYGVVVMSAEEYFGLVGRFAQADVDMLRSVAAKREFIGGLLPRASDLADRIEALLPQRDALTSNE
jgi:hypothetical protein